MDTLNITRRALSATLLLSFCISLSANAAYVEVDQVLGAESDDVASGRLLSAAGGSTLAFWQLESTVSNTDFENAHVGGGSRGLQYTMLNQAFGSTDVNSLTFSTSQFLPGVAPQISLLQSPYFDDDAQWNGGNLSTDISQFKVSWFGGGSATLLDPLSQLNPDQSDLLSGTTFVFSDYQIFNSEDAWQLILPAGIDSVIVDWSSSNPTAGSDLTREWIAFDTTIVSSATAVPEPNGLALGLLGLICLFVKRHASR